MYSAALCSHVNNIYHKISEIQQQLPHSTQHMNTGDLIQIEAPDFNPDIDEGLPVQEHQEAQGSTSITQQSFEKTVESKAPRCRRRRLAGHDTCQNPTTTRLGHQTKYTSIANKT